MSVLSSLTSALSDGSVEVIDLTAPLSASTPVLELPSEFGQTARFELEEISAYDDRGPAWYWNNFRSGEHTGTHFDAPNHWITGKGQGAIDDVPVNRMVAPAAVLDFSDEARSNPDFLIEVDHVKAWQDNHGPLPIGGWMLVRTGWDARSHSQEAMTNTDDMGSHTPGLSAECARWVAEQTSIAGMGVETVGTDAGAAGGFELMFPCHALLHGNGKYGLTSLQNLAQLPPSGAVLIAGPLPIVGGSGAPARALALVER